eukprot:UN27376
MTAKSFDLVDEQGESIGWPPLHRHHIHMYDGTQSNSLRVFARHGDDECTKETGGVACFYQEAPPGHGYFFPQKVNVDYEINDDRPAGSSPITWYFQVGLRLSLHEYYPLANVYNMRLANGFPLIEDDVMKVYFGLNVYWAPVEHPSLFWQTINVPFDMEIFRIQMHRHEFDLIFDSIYYIMAEPEELGLSQDPYIMKDPWTPLVLESKDDLMYFKRNLLKKLETMQDKILCLQKQHHTVDGYARKMLPCCDIPRDMDVGTPITVVWLLNSSDFEPQSYLGLSHHAIT